MEALKVIKIGGNVIDDENKLASFIKDFAAIPGKKILIHGGGKIATRIAGSLGYTSEMIDGKRVTDARMLQVAIMVYGGLVNKQLVAQLQAKGCNAIGLTGADAGIIRSEKRPLSNGVDYGYVGDVQEVEGKALDKMLRDHFIPVLAPLTHDGNGQMLNTNADNIAAFTAVALSSYYQVSLIYTFDLPGVMADIDDSSSKFDKISASEFNKLKEDKVIAKGMVAKLEACFKAIDKGVNDVVICNASDIGQGIEKGSFGTKLIAG